jgi:hypothetical protein
LRWDQAGKDRFSPVNGGGDGNWKVGPRQIIHIIGLVPPLAKLFQSIGIAFSSFSLQVGPQTAMVLDKFTGLEIEKFFSVVAGMSESAKVGTANC